MQVKSIEGEHSAIILTFIKLQFVIKIMFCLFLSGRFTQALLYVHMQAANAEANMTINCKLKCV